MDAVLGHRQPRKPTAHRTRAASRVRLADTARREREQRTRAEGRERDLRLNVYAERFGHALDAQKEGRAAQAVEFLNDLRPGPGEPDSRGFEWYYLRGLCHPVHDVRRGHRGPTPIDDPRMKHP